MRTSIALQNEHTARRFRQAKRRAQRRMDVEDLYHDEFVNLLLDVYEFHLDDSGESAFTGGASA